VWDTRRDHEEQVYRPVTHPYRSELLISANRELLGLIGPKNPWCHTNVAPEHLCECALALVAQSLGYLAYREPRMPQQVLAAFHSEAIGVFQGRDTKCRLEQAQEMEFRQAARPCNLVHRRRSPLVILDHLPCPLQLAKEQSTRFLPLCWNVPCQSPMVVRDRDEVAEQR
jgi:hypothetical protein